MPSSNLEKGCAYRSRAEARPAESLATIELKSYACGLATYEEGRFAEAEIPSTEANVDDMRLNVQEELPSNYENDLSRDAALKEVLEEDAVKLHSWIRARSQIVEGPRARRPFRRKAGLRHCAGRYPTAKRYLKKGNTASVRPS